MRNIPLPDPPRMSGLWHIHRSKILPKFVRMHTYIWRFRPKFVRTAHILMGGLSGVLLPCLSRSLETHNCVGTSCVPNSVQINMPIGKTPLLNNVNMLFKLAESDVFTGLSWLITHYTVSSHRPSYRKNNPGPPFFLWTTPFQPSTCLASACQPSHCELSY